MSVYLERAAKLFTLVCIAQARRSSHTALRLLQAMRSSNLSHQTPTTFMNQDHLIAGDVYEQLALGHDGQPVFEDDVDADALPVEWACVGQSKFEVIDSDAYELAQAACLVGDESEETLCLRVRFDASGELIVPALGNLVGVPTGTEGNATLMFLVGWTYADATAPLPEGFGGDATEPVVRNELLDSLRPGEALLVQSFFHESAVEDQS